MARGRGFFHDIAGKAFQGHTRGSEVQRQDLLEWKQRTAPRYAALKVSSKPGGSAQFHCKRNVASGPAGPHLSPPSLGERPGPTAAVPSAWHPSRLPVVQRSLCSCPAPNQRYALTSPAAKRRESAPDPGLCKALILFPLAWETADILFQIIQFLSWSSRVSCSCPIQLFSHVFPG